jgi:hypothetical protein
MSTPAETAFAPFPLPLDQYPASADANLGQILLDRIHADPFNLIATLLFLLAIVHTFLAPALFKLAHKIQHEHDEKLKSLRESGREIPPHHEQCIAASVLHFFGEVEAIFGIWVIPLIVAISLTKGWPTAQHYLNNTVNYTEPLFVIVVMAIASSRPVLQLASRLLALLAGQSPARWWFTLLTVGPLLGSFITEPAAMTICALLLSREFYRLNPSRTFMYATLGLLFVNVSVGGTLTNFAAPPVLMVAAKWDWSSLYMFKEFGDRAAASILLSNFLYFAIFRKEFAALTQNRSTDAATEAEAPTPFWITGVHLAFLLGTVLVSHYPALFIGGFLFFIAFTITTAGYQDELNIRSPLLVGFFLAGLVIHGGLQGWWIAPVLGSLSQWPLLFGATFLTAFNDNAAITYLATLVPDFSESLKIAVVSGAVAGGGLTVIANAPNPAGQSILGKYFPDGISPGALALAALPPTAIVLICFSVGR